MPTINLAEIRFKGIIGILTEAKHLPFAVWVAALVLCGVAAYLLGSLNFALIISKKKFGQDIRQSGSGNAGMTNMMRTYGRKAAGFTLLGDALKAVVSALIGTLLCGNLGLYIAGFCCILGHAFPIYYRFKGGKGVVTTAAMILCIDPFVFLILFAFFALIVACTKYISLGSVICMCIMPMLLHRMASPNWIEMIIAVLIALLVIILHRENIKRLCQGTENKFKFKK